MQEIFALVYEGTYVSEDYAVKGSTSQIREAFFFFNFFF